LLFPHLNSKVKEAIPQGFRYLPEFIDKAEEHALATALSNLDLKPFEFHGHIGNRRVVSFGLRYDYVRRAGELSGAVPPFLDDLRIKIAKFAGREVGEFVQLGVNEYRPGAGIGWHRDKPEFGDVVGVSLLHPAKMRFRRRKDNGWIRASQALEPRSVYILTGEARQVWEHSIPPLKSLRYSLTFRTLAREAPKPLLSD
jgi:alkylated DNA repair dioxygenase AlkB